MLRSYGGASSCNALYVMTLILNLTGIQCRSSRRIGVTCSRQKTPPNSVAAAFSIDCNRRMSHAGRPTNNKLSNPTGNLQIREATNVEHRAIVNDEQHAVDEVGSSTTTHVEYVLFQVEAVVKKYTPMLRAPIVGLTTIPPTDNDRIVKSILRWLDLIHRDSVLSLFSLSLLDFIKAQNSYFTAEKV